MNTEWLSNKFKSSKSFLDWRKYPKDKASVNIVNPVNLNHLYVVIAEIKIVSLVVTVR